MDEIKAVVRVQPQLLDVVDFEADIWRDPFGLDRTEVYTNYLSIRI